MRQIVATICVVTVLTAAGAMAQTPVISTGSGTFATGQAFALEGTGFGTKATAAPLKYDNFEAGSNGNELADWNFDTGGGDRNPEYSNMFVRPHSDRSAVCIYENGQYLSTFGVYEPSGMTTVYLDFWVLFDRPDPTARNHKLYRLYTGNGGGLPNQYLQLYCNDNQPTGHFTNDGVDGHSWGDTRAYPGWAADKAQHNWVHVQVYVEQSDAGVRNGVLKCWFDCGNKLDRDDYMSRGTVNRGDWHSLWFGNYSGHGSDGKCASSGDAHIYFDNIYVDVTQARVEAGNNADYDACTHREIQVPTSWNETSVNVTVNAGGFNSGQQVWLFLVNGSGAVSAGNGPFTVGGNIPLGSGQSGQPVRVN